MPYSSFTLRLYITPLLLLLLLLPSSYNYASDVIADPLEPINRVIYTFNDKLDIWLLKPIAITYNKVLPKPINTGISNFFSNLNDISVIINDLLQLKLKQAGKDSGRLLLNSTFGILGLIDVASDISLPKHHEDFGQTLGHWGIGSGWYLVLPVFGPSNIRDGIGLVVNGFSNPMAYIEDDTTRNSLAILSAIDLRAELLTSSDLRDDLSLDPYAFTRDSYQQFRKNLIYDGNPPLDHPVFDDAELDDLE